MSRRHLPPAEPVTVQAARIARADGERAAQWLAEYVADRGDGPTVHQIGRVMGWEPKLRWLVLKRLQMKGWVEFTDEPHSLRPGPAWQQGASQ